MTHLWLDKTPNLGVHQTGSSSYRANSAEGKVRHPFFKGLREDL
jgi:hypothetical protein